MNTVCIAMKGKDSFQMAAQGKLPGCFQQGNGLKKTHSGIQEAESVKMSGQRTKLEPKGSGRIYWPDSGVRAVKN